MTGGTPILRPVLQDADGNPLPAPRKLSLGFASPGLHMSRNRSMSMRSRIDSGHGLLPDPAGPIYAAPFYTPDGQLVYYPVMAAHMESIAPCYSIPMMPSRVPLPVPEPVSGLKTLAPQVVPAAQASSAAASPTLRPVENKKARSPSPMLSYGQLPVLAPPHPYPGYFVREPETETVTCAADSLKLECKEEFPEISLATQRQEKKKGFGKFKKPNKSGAATRETSQCSSAI